MLSRTMVVVACLLSCCAAFAGLNQDEVLENGAGRFAVEIPGCPEASANIQSVQVEDLLIDEREMTTGADWDYRVYGPGDAHYGSITIRSRVGKNSKELLQWLQDASVGKNIRKNISIIIKKRDGAEARRYNFLECFPIEYEGPSFDTSSTVQTECIVVQVGGVEFVSADEPTAVTPLEKLAATDSLSETLSTADALIHEEATSTEKLRAYGLVAPRRDAQTIYYRTTDGNEDNAWEACTGGALCIEVAPASTGASEHHVTTPGHKFVEEIQLRGPMTAGRKWIAQNINDTVKGTFTRFELTLVEIGKDGADVKRQSFGQCFVTRYEFPRLNVDASGPLVEGATIAALVTENGAENRLQFALNTQSQTNNMLTNMQKARHDAMMATIQNAR